MDFLSSITRSRNQSPHQTDIERFIRAIATNEPGPTSDEEIYRRYSDRIGIIGG